MIGAEDPHHVVQELFEQGQRPAGIPRPAGPEGDVVAGGEGVGVVGAEAFADPVSPGRPPGQVDPGDDVGAGGQAGHHQVGAAGFPPVAGLGLEGVGEHRIAPEGLRVVTDSGGQPVQRFGDRPVGGGQIDPIGQVVDQGLVEQPDMVLAGARPGPVHHPVQLGVAQHLVQGGPAGRDR